jgi:hypothetical protein
VFQRLGFEFFDGLVIKKVYCYVFWGKGRTIMMYSTWMKERKREKEKERKAEKTTKDIF